MTGLIPYTIVVTLLLGALAPLACAYAVRRAALLARDPLLRLPARPFRLWVHAASLGEVRLALRLIDALTARGSVARDAVLLTATNPAAVRLARRTHPHTHLAPVDHPWIVRRVVRAIRPAVLAVLETELWPAYIAYARAYGARVVLVNGRLAASTAVLLRLFRPLFAGSLDGFHRLLLREPLDALRFAAAGVPADRMRVIGNLKYDDPPAPSTVSRPALGIPADAQVVVFGSIREGEEGAIVRAIAALAKHPTVFCVAVPRHPRRARTLDRLLRRAGVPARLRSAHASTAARCLIVDTLGELRGYYAAADIAVVCGSFVRRGGQNPIEPAACGVPVLFGPCMDNFREPARVLCAAGGAERLPGAAAIPAAVERLLADASLRHTRGTAARDAVVRLRGATDRAVAELAAALDARCRP